MKHLTSIVQVFARTPVAGFTKTRLIPALGADGAASLASTLIKGLMARLSSLDVDIEVWYAGNTPEFFSPFGKPSFPQEGEDLGARMRFALEDGRRRYDQVVLVGTDCPPIDADYIDSALQALARHPVVLGPAEDGGYGLVAVSDEVPPMFIEVEWGTDQVLSQTCRHLNQGRVDYALLTPIWDVDRPEDLQRYEYWLNQCSRNHD